MSGKVALQFTIGGHAVTYNGNPANRVKDLMGILVKMEATPDAVLTAFRQNIVEQAQYTDEVISQLYQQRRAKENEKHQKKAGPAAAPAATTSVADTHEEIPQTITLHLGDNSFSYSGLLSSKPKAVVDLLVKQQAPPAMAVSAFRKNLPEISATWSDQDILGHVAEAKAAREARKTAKRHAQQETSLEPSAAVPVAQVPMASMEDTVAPGRYVDPNAYNGEAYPQTQLYPYQEPPPVYDEAMGLFDKQVMHMTPKDRRSVDQFINEVLNAPGPTLYASHPPTAFLSSSLAVGSAGDLSARSTEVLASRSVANRIGVYCHEEGSTHKKVVYTTLDTPFEEFSAAVQRKFGKAMALSYTEGQDRIEVDEDDVLADFLSVARDRYTLICTPMTEATASTVVPASVMATDEGETAADSNPVLESTLNRSGIEEPKAGLATAAAVGSQLERISNGNLEVTEEMTYRGHTADVYCCAFAQSGSRFATASRDGSVRVWQLESGGCTVMKGGHDGFVLSCDFSPVGDNVVSSAADRSIRVWNANTGNKVFSLKGHTDKVYCVKYCAKGSHIVSASCDRTLRVWHATSGVKQKTLRGHTLSVFSCCFSNLGNYKYVLSGSDDRSVNIWNWRDGKVAKALIGHTGTVWSCRFSHDDEHVVTASMDHEVKLWVASTGECTRTFTGHKHSVHHACFSPNSAYIFSCARDWSVMVWDVKTGEQVETILGHKNTVYHLTIRKNRMLTCSLDYTVKSWKIHDKSGLEKDFV